MLALANRRAPPHVPLQKTIGQARAEIVPSLIVMNARSASLQGGTLTLTGVAPNSIVFADRPVRAAGHSLTSTCSRNGRRPTQRWSFAKDPPNATISVFSSDGSKVQDAVVVLKSPVLEGDRLTFAVDVLEGDRSPGDGPAAVFIDRFGFGGFQAGSRPAAFTAEALPVAASLTSAPSVSAASVCRPRRLVSTASASVACRRGGPRRSRARGRGGRCVSYAVRISVPCYGALAATTPIRPATERGIREIGETSALLIRPSADRMHSVGHRQ